MSLPFLSFDLNRICLLSYSGPCQVMQFPGIKVSWPFQLLLPLSPKAPFYHPVTHTAPVQGLLTQDSRLLPFIVLCASLLGVGDLGQGGEQCLAPRLMLQEPCGARIHLESSPHAVPGSQPSPALVLHDLKLTRLLPLRKWKEREEWTAGRLSSKSKPGPWRAFHV